MSEPSLKKHLKSLKLEKGIASRKIGAAKKAGENADIHIEEVKNISQKIQEIEAEIKIQNKKNTSEKEAIKLPLAPQFTPLKIRENQATLSAQLHSDQTTWDDYVQQHANATIYHGWSIKRVVENCFNHNTTYISVIDEKQKIQGVLPLIELKSKLFGHSLVSVPFFNYGGMLYSSSAARKKLLDAAIEQAKNVNAEHIELRDCKKYDDLPSKEAKVTMHLNLPKTSEELWKNLGTKLRAQIKKAERNNLKVKIGRDELLSDFYSVFAQNMRDLGTPVYSKILFSQMLEQNPTARIAIIYHQNKPVSCGFILGWRNTMEIPWASTLRSANKLDANMKLYWEILKFTTDQGYEIFDFGRSSKDANTYKFKKQWGAKPFPLYWHYWLTDDQPLPEINPNNPKYKIIIAVWQKLPVWLANIIGPSIVKNLP